MKLLFQFLTIGALSLVSASAAADWRTSKASCEEKITSYLPKASPAHSKKEASNELCKDSVEQATCKQTFDSIYKNSEEIRSEMQSLCDKVASIKGATDGTDAQAKVAQMSGDVKKQASIVKRTASTAATEMAGLKRKHLAALEKLSSGSDVSEASKNFLKEIKSKKELSEEEFKKLRKKAQTSGSQTFREQGHAALSAIYAETTWLETAKDLGEIETVSGDIRDTTDKNRKEAGLLGGMGLKDMVPLLAAGAPLAAMLMNKNAQNSNSSSTGGSSDTGDRNDNAVSTDPRTVTNESAEGTRSVASVNNPTFDSQGASTNKPELKNTETPTPTSASISPPDEAKESLLNGFSKGLGGTPFSGSSSSLGGSGASLSAGGGATTAEAENGKQTNPHSGNSNDFASAAGGGGFGSFGSSVASDPSMKDLFKTPELEGEKTLDGLNGLAGFSDSNESSTFAGVMGSVVPGADDSRSLFARVRDSHRRCQKKGCVTSESGGKIP